MKWGTWKSLKKAMRLFTQSLKQEHHESVAFYEIVKLRLLTPITTGYAKGVAYFNVVFNGGQRFERKVEFSLLDEVGYWYIADFKGGPSEFLSKDHSTDISAPHV